jgi:competence protein ComFB
MRLKDMYNLDNIVNKSAELVYEGVEDLLRENKNFCRCQDCILDLIAYTLNHVTPLYRTSLLGPLHPSMDLEKKVKVEIELALNAGIKKITRHPHHEDAQSA